jgi:hypothetical protein
MIELDSMAVPMPHVEGHPNRRSFCGVLTTLDTPSTRAPSGAKGHLVVLTKKAAEAALPSLLGMALDYAPTLDRHDVRRKVGVITRAEIVGRNLELGGHIFARDFPEIVEEIARSRRHRGENSTLHSCAVAVCDFMTAEFKRRTRESRSLRASLKSAARQIRNFRDALERQNQARKRLHAFCEDLRGESQEKNLGLSYEVTDVQLADPRARVWMLEKVTFTGAAILRRDKAAYRDTWIELGS